MEQGRVDAPRTSRVHGMSSSHILKRSNAGPIWRRPWVRLAATLVGALPGLSHAAGLTVQVSDAAGVALVDAVVMLEPAAGGAPVKPMADVEISQLHKQFRPRVTLITTGTRVTFPNFDTVRHHVYSFSPIKPFELKLYAGVPNQPIVFDKPGVAVLGCNIHDNMVAWVVVADTPWSARSAASGRAHLDGLPSGAYQMRVWHPGMGVAAQPTTVALTLGAADVEQAVHLPVKAEP